MLKTMPRFSLLYIGAFAVFAGTANGQTQRTGDTNARAMQQLQQLTVERTQLKADNDKLKQELESLKKELTAATKDQSSLQQRLKSAELAAARDSASTQQNTETLEKLRGQMQELVGRFRETATTLKEVEGDRNTARGQLQLRERELNTCVERNVGLFDLNTQALDRLEHKGVWNSLTEKEPFTRIQRTRLENLIDDYRERAAALRLENKGK
jgi:cell division septum initiation protein DivIVA